MERVNNIAFKSFEFMGSLVGVISCLILRITVVYWPPASSMNSYTTAFFFDEFSTMLERLVSLPGKLLITSDLYFHINNPSDSRSLQFLDNNILDLVMRSGKQLALNPSVNDPGISDHFAVHNNLPVSKPQNPKIVSTTKNYEIKTYIIFYRTKLRLLCSTHLHQN